ncbi:alpha/beta hydrolase [Micropruina glycogenica]|uniref:Putative esterase n=1 Tax=Micropruina glycogenica TaxID=75385 RepID=A0A2N9JLA9_9ACTN|nr:alpha/beta hydrolase-fold protein [Micropruina glycogenica]SPD88371.1 putative esterase [Micropruina glycogenica]
MPLTTEATTVETDRVVFRLTDTDPGMQSVRLWSEVPVAQREFERTDDGWLLEIPHPGAHRVEYLFELSDGLDTVLVTDPTNPLLVEGVFGDHSWLPMPGYAEPAWLDAPRVEGRATPVAFDTADGSVTGELWAPADTWRGTPLPLLISHDGTQMARYGRLTDFIAAAIAGHELPPLRLLLLDPGPDRNARYAANARYAKALVEDIIPAVNDQVTTLGTPVLMGQSLGALAALHAARRHPGTFAGLFLQSGSFFTPEFDPQERGYSRWAEVTGFTSTLYTSPAPERIPSMFVCGTQEENLANNVALAAHLAEIGGDIGWGDVPDGHTWTTWRDLLDPHLTRLLQEAWP